MPRIYNTRKQRADELLRLLAAGPSFREERTWNDPDRGYEYQYRLWAESWILPDLKRLVPELKPKTEHGTKAAI